MFTSYPTRLRIAGEFYVLAQPRAKTKPPATPRPDARPSATKPKPTKPTRRPSHRRPPAPKTTAPPRKKVPGGQFDLSKLRVPRHPEVRRAWQTFREQGKFRVRGKKKEVSWETLRNQDPQTAFELKRKFVDAWRKRLQQQGVAPDAPAAAEEAKPAPPTDDERAREAPNDEKADDEKADDEKADDEKADDEKADDEKADDEKATVETRHKPPSTRAPAEEDIPEVAPEDVEELPDDEEEEKKPDSSEEEKSDDEEKADDEKPEDLSSLLQPPQPVSKDDKEVAEKRSTLEGVINGLGLRGKLGDKVAVGPTVTSFTVEVPKGQDFDGEKLADRLEKDEDIKVIVGKQHGGKVEVQVPNAKRSTVVLRQVTDSPEFKAAPPSAIVMGVDPVGKPLLLDLAKAESPHVLVTGTTGSGKSVAIQSMLASVMLRSPKDTKLVVIDPKNEFQSLDGVPHLAMPRISDDKGTIAQDATAALHKLTQEMDERVRKIGAHKDLKTYNEANPEKKMPRVVVVIDEFKDLMGESGGDFQKHLGRLLQKARSTGIHVIMGTQELTSGMLKEKAIRSNLPVRIAFRAANKQSSHNTLEEAGAEQLMGGGDGLIKVGGKLQRFQAPYISDKGKDNEWGKLTDALRQKGTDYDPALHQEAKPAKPETKPAAPGEKAKPPAPGAKPPAKPEEPEDLTEHAVKDDEDETVELRDAESLKEGVPADQISAEEQTHAKYFGPLGKLTRYKDHHLTALHEDAWQRLRQSVGDHKHEQKKLHEDLKAAKGDPEKTAIIQQKIDEDKRTQKEFAAAAKYHLKTLGKELAKRGHEVPEEYDVRPEYKPQGDEADTDEDGPDYRDYTEPGEHQHTAPPVQVTRRESWRERRERRKDEKAQAKQEKAKATEEQVKTKTDGPLPSPTEPKPDVQAAQEHLREQGVSETVAKHVSELLNEPHDPAKMHQAMSTAIDKGVAALNDPNARADVLATKGSVAHVLAKKFGAGTKRVKAVLRSWRKSAGGLWSKIWGGIKKLFGAVGKGLAWLFKKIGRAARRFGTTVTGIEARRQARENRMYMHQRLRTPPHYAPVTAQLLYRGVPYLAYETP